ncbi:MAG: IS21 family transposase, partial [Pseudomonadota bacterium]
KIHRELRRKGVTLQLLWQEYKQDHPDGYQYSQFCEHYRRWRRTIDITMRQEHRAGEKLFVDWAGQTVGVVDSATGEIRQAYIFVAVLGASNYTYAEASWTQDLASWIAAHTRAFEFFGGTPAIIVPDNLTTGVSRPCRYEPDINPAYHDLAQHYGTVVIPARVRKPKDKAKVENGVLQVSRSILAELRNRTFFSLSELNQAIREGLETLNYRPFQKLEGSRYSHYISLDRPALKPLPTERYEFAQWKKARVNIDYHIEVDANYYSVPYQLIRRQVDVRLTSTTVEVLYKGKRVASHGRLYDKGRYSTVFEHRPPAHQKYLQWTPERLINWANTIGPDTAQMVQTIMRRRPVPEQGFRSCLGLFRLGKRYSPERLEAACARALALGAYSYKSV